MRAATVFFWCHATALALAMFGLLSAVPNPGQFAGNAMALSFYAWAIANLGTVDILSAVLAMTAYGFATLGVRRTLIFAAAACILSASAELTGTQTGWPFGGYTYTSFLGWKIADHVPYTVPLSWYYMGFASFLIGARIVRLGNVRNETLWSIVLGAYLLTAWDLVLDPAMASPKLAYMHFWIWKESGPYFGMPLRNLAGWFATGLLFIAAGRLLWRGSFDPLGGKIWLPVGIYAVNVLWAMALSLSVGLWQTAVLALALSLAPAALALRPAPRRVPSIA